MLCYLIEEALNPCELGRIREGGQPYVVVLNRAEWIQLRDLFDMGIDIEPEEQDILATKAVVNYDSVTGAFSVPFREDPAGPDARFAFAFDEKGIVFIDENGEVEPHLLRIAHSRRWRRPSLARFVYDFLDGFVSDDQRLLEGYELKLSAIEDAIIGDEEGANADEVTMIRRDLRSLRVHYEQLIDLAEVLEDNENGFFAEEELRYFRLLAERVHRLRDTAYSLSDFSLQVRDAYKTHLDIRQNSIMTVLTVVTTVFTPLTLITGWYGMNFVHMPELAWKGSYPVVIVVSAAIVVGSLYFFRKNKWL